MTKKTQNLNIIKHISKASEIQMLSMIGVYKMWHLMDSERCYVGSTSNTNKTKNALTGFYTRWSSHLSELRRGTNVSVGDLQSIVNKHGIEGIRFSILDFVITEKNAESVRIFT